MRHHDGALVLGLHFLADQLRDLLAAVRVQARGRLVCQDQLRLPMKARAIAARCFWPPDIWRGYLV